MSTTPEERVLELLALVTKRFYDMATESKAAGHASYSKTDITWRADRFRRKNTP